MCAWVRLCVCMRVCMRASARVRACLHASVCACACVFACMRACVRARVGACVRACVRACMVRRHVCVCTLIYFLLFSYCSFTFFYYLLDFVYFQIYNNAHLTSEAAYEEGATTGNKWSK